MRPIYGWSVPHISCERVDVVVDIIVSVYSKPLIHWALAEEKLFVGSPPYMCNTPQSAWSGMDLRGSDVS